jgi:outer membrane protein assembly factor BamB
MLKTVSRALAVAVLSAGVGAGQASGADWPNWRGPSANGTSPERNLPERWSLTENLAWTLPLPSASGSTSIVSGDRVFLSVVDGDEVGLWCVDRRTGKVSWKRPVGPAEGHAHRKHNMSSPSPVTGDGRVFTMTGKGVLKGFSFEGQELWARDLQADYGPFGTAWGYGSSPLLFNGTLYVQVLHGHRTDDPSYLLGLDPASGKNRFHVERPTTARRESPDAYTTPAVARRDGQAEIILTGGDLVTGHDPATGKELWRDDGLNPGREGNFRIIASALVHDDIVVASARGGNPILALRAFGKGDVTGARRLWSFARGPDVPTPTTDGTRLYVVTDKGILSCLELETGKTIYGPVRLAVGTYSASPLLADGKLYVTSEDAVTSVIRAGSTFELIAENALEGFTLSSFAAVQGQLFLRAGKTLYCIGKSGS